MAVEFRIRFPVSVRGERAFEEVAALNTNGNAALGRVSRKEVRCGNQIWSREEGHWYLRSIENGTVNSRSRAREPSDVTTLSNL